VHRLIEIADAPFDLAAHLRAFLACVDGESGGVASYCGLVRDRFADRPVDRLMLEHYPGMTERSIERIVAEAERRWTLQAVSVVHRVGAVDPCEPIVLVMVASAHRESAFAACELVMDLLKTEAVFWKKELSPEGERWVESTDLDRERVARWRDEH
jgi:molybdopterin synthase catalytic subunit